MTEQNPVTIPDGYTLASTLYNKVLHAYMTRQLFYSSIVPIFERAGKSIRDGRYLYIEANLSAWETYAEYRRAQLASGAWIKRRPWSLEDLDLAVSAPPLQTDAAPVVVPA